METIISNKYLIGISAAISSMLLTILAQYILNKRSKFRYYVWHNHIGLSTEDSIFGSVKILWNNTSVPNLFLSTVELINESMKDFENISVRVFTNDTYLLTEKTEIVGTTYSLTYTDKFSEKIKVEENSKPTPEQLEFYRKQREYLIPILNRGQMVRFTFLNSSKTLNKPTIWLDVLYKGILLDFRVAPNKIFNVSQPMATVIGLLIGIVVVGFIIVFIRSIPLAAVLSFIYGLLAQLPGVLFIKLWSKIKQRIIG